MDKSRHEILPQLAILDERVMPVKVKIYERYFRINDFFTPEHEIRERSKELTEIIVAYTTGVKTEDVIDLPEENNYVIKCKVPPVAYDILLRDRVLYDDFDNKYVADSKALLRLGLKELCSGYLRMTSPENKDVYIKFDNSLKIAKLTRLVANIPKGIIYYEFTNSIDDIVKVIHSVDKTCVVVNGETSAKKSTELINAFKKGEVDYLVIQSKSGNAGLDLTNVHDVIFYALPDSYIVFHQAKSRIRRIGQTQECNYYYLVCENSVERIIYDTLAKKKSFNDRIFAQYL